MAGKHNVTWSFVGSAGFFAGGAIFAFDPEAVFWAPLAAHLAELAWFAIRSGALRTTSPRPGSITPFNGGAYAQTVTAEGCRESGAPGGAQRLASTDGGAQRQDPVALWDRRSSS